MNTNENKAFRWLHNYTNEFVDKNKSDITKDDDLRKLNIIYRELIIRNTVMNVTSPKFFKYILKNKI
jgi:hypothetical protein